MALSTLFTPQYRSLLILALVMLVNALSYGTIIPLLYPYSSQFGIDPLGLSLLVASYSFFQLIATPIIGRLSDKYGRKPLLLFCLAGTSVSLALFAMARSVEMLFLARILDGITGGNVSVAQAIISDTTTGERRARAFGILGAAFGFGFLLGPALGGLLSEYSSITTPFWVAAALALIGTILGVWFLPETLPKRARTKAVREPLFRWHAVFGALLSPTVGSILLVSFLAAIGHNAFIIGFQSFTFDVLKLDKFATGILFTIAGVVTVIMQSVGIGYLLKRYHSKKRILLFALGGAAAALALLTLSNSLTLFTIGIIVYMVVQAPYMPMVAALLSERTHDEDQGSIMGFNQAYNSLGQIIGPVLAGLIAQRFQAGVFLMSGVIIFFAAVVAKYWVTLPVKRTQDL